MIHLDGKPGFWLCGQRKSNLDDTQLGELCHYCETADRHRLPHEQALLSPDEAAYEETHPDSVTNEPEEMQPDSGFWTVYLADHQRLWGGPEEGGWWYDIYPVVGREEVGEEGWFQPALFGSLKQAQDYLATMNQWIDDKNLNEGRRDVGSVLSTGFYVSNLCDGYPPTSWPRPHYE